jgi:hypothetical protein
MKTSISLAIPIVGLAMFALSSCMPQREFVQFGNPGTFHPGPRHSGGGSSGPDGEYDSYELVDHGGVPNQGIPPMYSGQQGNYPAAVQGYDAYGNPVTVIVPNPW